MQNVECEYGLRAAEETLSIPDEATQKYDPYIRLNAMTSTPAAQATSASESPSDAGISTRAGKGKKEKDY
jgi:hypothetical protein